MIFLVTTYSSIFMNTTFSSYLRDSTRSFIDSTADVITSKNFTF